MTINFYDSIGYSSLFGGHGAGGTETAYALDSNYTFYSAGKALGIRFIAPNGNVSVKSVYIFLHAANATSHNLQCDLAATVSGGIIRPANSIIRSVTASGGTTATKWLKFDFSSYNDVLTPGQTYFATIGDPSGLGSSYSIRSRSSCMISINATPLGEFYSHYSTSDGFATVGTSTGASQLSIVTFSDGSAAGVPYTRGLNGDSNTLERGMKFIFDEKITCCGISWVSSSTNSTTLQIYQGSTSPNGTVWSGFNGGTAYTLLEAQKRGQGVLFPSPVTFEKNTYYRITIKSSSAHTYPGYNEIEDYATLEANALKIIIGAGSWCYTIDNGAGGWTDYNNATDGYRLARMSLILKQQEVISGGGIYSFGG